MPEDIRRAAEPDDLGRASEITPADRAIAPRFWAQYATPLLRALLNAVKRETT